MLEHERPRGGERAVLVHIDLHNDRNREYLDEFVDLAASAGVVPAELVTATRRSPDPRSFIGSGKAEELRERVRACDAEVVLFNHELAPSQERNLERLLGCRVLDRNTLILDIFAQRARSFEGKLQVELAQLRHLSSRLVRGWTHLERQKGGIGLRGPGETQLETDRRLLAARIRRIRKRLQRVDSQREQGRQARRRAEAPTAAVVGYTNAGKSTLFNALAEQDSYAADQLFATLDPTLRRADLGRGRDVVLADTVGFIRHLPHELVAAFKATLQETREAQLLVHVVDAAQEDRADKIGAVESVLAEIGATEVPRLTVFNKIDRLGLESRLERDADGRPARVWISARTGEGLDLLREALAECLLSDQLHGWLRLEAGEGRLRAALHELGAVLQERVEDDGGLTLELQLRPAEFERLCDREDLDRHRFRAATDADRVAGAA